MAVDIKAKLQELEKASKACETAFKAVEKTAGVVFNLMAACADEDGVINVSLFAGKLNEIKLNVKEVAPVGYDVARKYSEVANRALKTTVGEDGAVYKMEDFGNYAQFAAVVKGNYETMQAKAKIKPFDDSKTDGAKDGEKGLEEGKADGETAPKMENKILTELMGILGQLNEDNLRLVFDNAAELLEEQNATLTKAS